eukprot:tig00000403_g264.t1
MQSPPQIIPARQPGPVVQEVQLNPPSPLKYITFKNYYSAFVTVQIKFVDDERVWATVVREQQLMKHPHYEDESQNWHVIPVQAGARPVCRLRLIVANPSPCWTVIGIRDVEVFTE